MSDLDALRQAVQVSPDNVPLLRLLGEACLDSFRPEEALAAYERAVSLDAGCVEARIGCARALNIMGRSSEAVVRLEALLASRPEDPAVLRLLAKVLLGEGNVDQARVHYEKLRQVPGGGSDPELDRELGTKPQKPAKTVRLSPLGSPDDILQDDDEESSENIARVEAPKVTFEDVGGMEAIKEEIRMKVLHPVRKPELFRAYGKKIGGGVLLYGPPGCGKTWISRATAGELGAGFLSIGLHEVLDLYLGNSEKNLHELFELARRSKPAVLFIDEVDALAANRVDLRRSAGRTLINQLLAEMDGSDSANEGLLVLGATNAPWHLDAAFLRPGRFDRAIFVPPPDEAARAEIVRLLARDRPVVSLDAEALARKTKDFSGADLMHVFERATEACLTRAMQEDRVVPISQKQLEKSASEMKPSTRAWFEGAKSYALYANQSGLYDDILAYLRMRP